MTQITGLAEAALYVQDLDRATQFYVEALGLTLTASFDEARFLQTGRDSTLILFNAEGIQKRQSAIPAHGAHGPGHIALAVPAEEMAAWRARLQALGVAIEHEQDWAQDTHSIYFRDPDGNSVELIDDHHYSSIWNSLQQ